MTTYTVFRGHTRIATGPLSEVTRIARQNPARSGECILAFSDDDARQTELDLRPDAPLPAPPSDAEIADQQECHPQEQKIRPGRGRPRLGVVAREVTLLPRHWQWLGQQPGGASVALRKLVDLARKLDDGATQLRKRQEAAYRFLTAIAGDLPGYEEVLRALFAADISDFDARMEGWPPDIRRHAHQLVASLHIAKLTDSPP